MNQKTAGVKDKVIDVGSKDVEIVESNISRNNTNKNNVSFGKELASGAVQQVAVEVGKEVATVAVEQIKKHLDNEREGKKKIRDTRIDSLKLEIENLMENIQKEEAKKDFDQERINKWSDRLDKKALELKDMQDEADGFAKGLLKAIKQFATTTSRRK